MPVENSKGECNLGQHEINFRYGPALSTADEHVIYKNGAKEIAAQEGMAITYMAKYDEREGNSCHIHLSLREEDGTPLFGTDDQTLLERFIAGQLATLRELTLLARAERQLLQALRRRLVRPDRRRLGPRQPHVRAPRRRPRREPARRVPPPGRRREPVPRARRAHRRRPARHRPRARRSSRPSRATPTSPTSRTCPRRCARPRTCSRAARVAGEAFADEVVDHYLNNARVELEAFEAAVTDWERFRGFERL